MLQDPVDDELLSPPQNIAHLHHLDRHLLFAGYDLWRNGGFGHGGVVWSPGGLEREGFTLKLLLAGGLYRYHNGSRGVIGRQELVSVMAGWRFKRDALDVTLFAGPDFQSHHFIPDDPGNRMRGTQAGLRVGGDLWYQPSSQTMVSLGVSASNIGNNYWSRVAFGWRLAGLAWIGPEAQALGGGRYRQVRFGAHATALRFGAFEWTFGLGHARDSDDRDGFYASFGLITRR
jgi:hypothetical protein